MGHVLHSAVGGNYGRAGKLLQSLGPWIYLVGGKENKPFLFHDQNLEVGHNHHSHFIQSARSPGEELHGVPHIHWTPAAGRERYPKPPLPPQPQDPGDCIAAFHLPQPLKGTEADILKMGCHDALRISRGKETFVPLPQGCAAERWIRFRLTLGL